MGVVDGSTPYGNVVGAGPEKDFPTPPTVVADPNRRSLATSDSTSRNWMREFFTTTSNPVGHGFTQANLDKDFACYAFEPKSDLPIKVIVLDDTNKKNDKLGGLFYCGTGGLDQTRLDWLKGELQKGQDEGKLMIIAAHIPIKPQASLARQHAHTRLLQQGRGRRVARHAPLLSESHFVDRGASPHQRDYRPAEQSI